MPENALLVGIGNGLLPRAIRRGTADSAAPRTLVQPVVWLTQEESNLATAESSSRTTRVHTDDWRGCDFCIGYFFIFRIWLFFFEKFFFVFSESEESVDPITFCKFDPCSQTWPRSLQRGWQRCETTHVGMTRGYLGERASRARVGNDIGFAFPVATIPTPERYRKTWSFFLRRAILNFHGAK
jgi:hypothetical protein